MWSLAARWRSDKSPGKQQTLRKAASLHESQDCLSLLKDTVAVERPVCAALASTMRKECRTRFYKYKCVLSSDVSNAPAHSGVEQVRTELVLFASSAPFVWVCHGWKNVHLAHSIVRHGRYAFAGAAVKIGVSWQSPSSSESSQPRRW
jgi:hypothetical protein